MIVYNQKIKKRGGGLMNKIINKLPFELHLPGYNYCGPGTKLAARLTRGDPPVNQLDSACKEHDIAYSKNRDNVSSRNEADRVLADKAWQRVFSRDSSIGEKAAAHAVTNAMNLKSKLGMGLKSKRIKDKSILTKNGKKTKRKVDRTLPVPSKIGGVLPLLPFFAGLSATVALAGGAAGVYKAINDAKSSKQQLDENKRHNKTMEAIAMGKGLYLKRYKNGKGLYLKR